MSPGFMRDETGSLANEAYFSNPIVSFSGFKIKNYRGDMLFFHDFSIFYSPSSYKTLGKDLRFRRGGFQWYSIGIWCDIYHSTRPLQRQKATPSVNNL